MDELKKYREAGFTGFIPVSELRKSLDKVPAVGGTYLVIRDKETAPEFLEVGTGGHFKDKNPNVKIEKLSAKVVDGSKIMYIGKGDNLYERLEQLLKFGAGENVGHWGGRYLWQLKDAEEFLIAWRESDGITPRNDEKRLFKDYESVHGKLPFANLKH